MALKRKALEAAIPPDNDIVLDTAPLVAYLEGAQSITDVATVLIDDWIRAGRNRGIVSTISAVELFVGTERAARGTREVLDFLHDFPNVRTVSVDLGIAAAAASLRATTSLRTPDALVIGTAVFLSAGVIATNDREWSRKCPELPIVTLSDFV